MVLNAHICQLYQIKNPLLPLLPLGQAYSVAEAVLLCSSCLHVSL